MSFKFKLLFFVMFGVGWSAVYVSVLGLGTKFVITTLDLELGALKDYGLYIFFLLAFLSAWLTMRFPQPNLLGALKRDHSNFNDALTLLEEEANRLTTCYTDTSIVEGLMKYFADYPEGAHRAREKVVFAALVEKDPGAASLTASLDEEHEMLAEGAKALAISLPEIDKPTSVSPEDFLKNVGKFCDRFRDHSDRENKIFRRARKLLSDAVWERLDVEAPPGSDPLFGGNVPEKYREIRSHLIPGDSGSGETEEQAADGNKPEPAAERS